MPLDKRRRLGDFGEAAAAAYLIRQGYTIRDQNWRCSAGELDLIAQQRDQVVFVEVRTRRNTAPVSPEESITPAKQTRLVALAYAYLETCILPDSMSWRIDIIAIELDRTGRIIRLDHIPNAIEQG